MPDGLHRAVVGPLDDSKPVAEPVDRLVVRAVDRETLAVERDQQGIDGMRAVEEIVVALVAVAGDILVQRAAQEDVDQLAAAADAEDRPLLRQKELEQLALPAVPLSVDADGAEVSPPPGSRSPAQSAGSSRTISAPSASSALM